MRKSAHILIARLLQAQRMSSPCEKRRSRGIVARTPFLQSAEKSFRERY
ncbi:MAG: hypothetical protein LUD39_07285 [Opitutae bacterium]|nr:hypothetical protein [Opitutae bacterium]MCD8299532.1 hypothetical protein [Opitutae bacterium]